MYLFLFYIFFVFRILSFFHLNNIIIDAVYIVHQGGKEWKSEDSGWDPFLHIFFLPRYGGEGDARGEVTPIFPMLHCPRDWGTATWCYPKVPIVEHFWGFYSCVFGSSGMLLILQLQGWGNLSKVDCLS